MKNFLISQVPGQKDIDKEKESFTIATIHYLILGSAWARNIIFPIALTYCGNLTLKIWVY
jgi:hypothetical protein